MNNDLYTGRVAALARPLLSRTRLSLGAALGALMFSVAAPLPAAAEGPVLVELFTSQGCSSCPPADALIGELAAEDDILPLSFHVDYWDYLGWRDTFAEARFTDRQVSYRDAWGDRVVYTPQVVVAGVAPVVGSREGEVRTAIAGASAAPAPGRIEIIRRDGALVASLADLPTDSVLQVAVFDKAASVEIARGENAGREMTYHHVVRDFMRIGSVAQTGRALNLPEPMEGQGVAIWAQEPDYGAVVATARYLAGGTLAAAE
ncbi:MAG: DUF1223 domain-containing protein [Pseudomonadota bacterium]